MPDSGVKISSLPSAAAEDIQGTDVLAGVSDDATKKFTFTNILTWIKARLSKSDIGLDNVANVLQYSASNPPPYPVTSVNGQIGAVSITIPTPASPSDASPAMDGTAAAGSSPDFARGDHVHPTDTSRQATINVSGVLAGDGNGGIAAVTVDSSPDTSHTSNLISSAAVAGALTDLESDLAAIHATGTTNTTGAAISSGTYFYLNGALVQAKANIASGATFTSGTNYAAVTAGGLNDLKSTITVSARQTLVNFTVPVPEPSDTNWHNASGTFDTTYKWYLIQCGPVGGTSNTMVVPGDIVRMINGGVLIQLQAFYDADNQGQLSVYNGTWVVTAKVKSLAFEIKIQGIN